MAKPAKPLWHHVCSICGGGFNTTEALDTICDNCLMLAVEQELPEITTEYGKSDDTDT